VLTAELLQICLVALDCCKLHKMLHGLLLHTMPGKLLLHGLMLHEQLLH
jgi:hypothetical protein